MIQVNEYFGGEVRSLGFETALGRQTVGVLLPGTREFSTETPEIMTLVAGSWEMRLPGDDGFRPFPVGEAVSVPGGSRFEVRTFEMSAYHCRFL